MIDRYTKVCLTVIAVSLAAIGLRGLPMIDPAWAAGGVQKIAICHYDGDKCLVSHSEAFLFRETFLTPP
jgi:hypothetical protein